MSIVVFHPLFNPLNNLIQIPLQVLRSITGELVDYLLLVGFHGFLKDSLEDLTLHIVLELLSYVPSEYERYEAKSLQQEAYSHTIFKQISQLYIGLLITKTEYAIWVILQLGELFCPLGWFKMLLLIYSVKIVSLSYRIFLFCSTLSQSIFKISSSQKCPKLKYYML